VEIASAVQEGNVVLARELPAKAGAQKDVERATAAKVVYDGDSDKSTLTGAVQMSDATGTMWADKVSVEQQTGDAVAEGGVKASYKRPGDVEPVHVIAARADMKRDAGQAVFTGGTSPARLWQSGSQVEAPVLEFTQKKQTGQGAGPATDERKLVAHGNGRSPGLVVHTVLVSSAKPSSGEKKSVAHGSVLRVASREMVYSDAAHSAVFSGGVVIESADGTMHGKEATAYLQQQKTPQDAKAAVPAGLLGGSVDKVVVNGNITMEQPGRSAMGEQLVYTAADGTFVLTGRPSEEPRVMDQARGTVTGAELRFRTGDESVVISKEGSGTEQRVHTETQVKKTK
jgi:lipopolysaccharide export system protein LptA